MAIPDRLVSQRAFAERLSDVLGNAEALLKPCSPTETSPHNPTRANCLAPSKTLSTRAVQPIGIMSGMPTAL